MSFGISGAHGTGKTTLARAIAAASNLVFFETKTTELLAEIGISGVNNLDIETRFRAQNHLLMRFWEISQKHPRPFISDRTPLDYVGYMLAEVSMHNTSAELGARIDDYVERALRVTSNTYLAVIVLDRLPAYDADPKRPAANLAFQRHHQLLVEAAAYRLPSSTNFYRMTTTDPEHRIDGALQAIKTTSDDINRQRAEARLM